MKAAATLIVGFLFANQAMAIDCPKGNPAVFSVEDIAADPKGDGVVVWVGFKNQTQKIIRLAHGTAYIEDALSVPIGAFPFTIDDVQIPRVLGSIHFKTTTMERLRTLSSRDVRSVLCTEAVLYEDGTQQRF